LEPAHCGKYSSGKLPKAKILLANRKDAIDIHDRKDLEEPKEMYRACMSQLGDLIDIAPSVELQNKNHLACLINFINKPVFAKSYPESG